MLDREGLDATPVRRVDALRADVTAGSSSDGGMITDPGIRLLTKIGDFVEPLTRFDRGHLTLESSQHVNVDVVARQVFRVAFETIRSEGNGGLPQGVMLAADAAAMAQLSEGQLAASRAAVSARLSAWAAEHGERPAARPAVGDCFTALPAVGHVETCAPCQGAGKIACAVCEAAETLTCEACEGRGSNPCKACNATGDVTCATCKGMKTVVTHRERKVHDEDNNARIEHVQETATCGSCNGTGITRCGKCGGRSAIICATCHGQKTIPCASCKGAGSNRCETCGGEGRRHFTAQVSCAIRETFETNVRTPDPETTSVLKGLDSIDRVLGLAATYRSAAETSADTLRRETTAVTPVTTVTVVAGGSRAQVRGFGPQQDVLDYRNIAGMLLSDDLGVLEEALLATRLMPPRVTDAMHGSLATVLASEANVAIAENAAKKDQSGIASRFRGVVTADYITWAGGAIKTAMTRAYWAMMAKGPVAVLAIPLILMPIDLLVRGQGQGGRLMALLGVMLMTFFAALAAHYWVVQELQKKLAPEGAPKIQRIVDKLNLTLHWLAAAGVAAAVLTVVVASLTGLLLPMSPPVIERP
ncbi:MAG: hypothetical protein Q8R82_06630 [Hyphomonadaceae bacterium]|nr:hypothetical protein [Hyphomonadaceae bacterium]